MPSCSIFSGFAVLAVAEIDGELEVLVETTAARVGCLECGVIAWSHDRREVVVRDVDAFGRHSRLRWRKRVWRCREPACPQRTWTETHPQIRPRMSLTERARKQACQRVGRDGHLVAEVARDLGSGWHAVMRAVSDHGQPLVDDPDRIEGVTALGMDETAFLRARRDRPTLFVSGLVDTLSGRLLDVVADRTAIAVASWLARRDRRWLRRIGIVTLDPHRGYANAVGVHLGHATLVVDHFHIVSLANRMIDDVRRRVQQQQTGHRGRKHDPLYRIRKLLLKACDDLDIRGWWRLAERLRLGDPDHELLAAWQLKEIARDVYRTRDEHRPAKPYSCCTPGPKSLPRQSVTASRAPCAVGKHRSWPGTAPAAPPTAPPKQSTCSSKKSKEPGTVSATSKTTGSAYYCTAVLPGNINPPRDCGPAPHD
jgi:transposase